MKQLHPWPGLADLSQARCEVAQIRVVLVHRTEAHRGYDGKKPGGDEQEHAILPGMAVGQSASGGVERNGATRPDAAVADERRSLTRPTEAEPLEAEQNGDGEAVLDGNDIDIIRKQACPPKADPPGALGPLPGAGRPGPGARV